MSSDREAGLSLNCVSFRCAFVFEQFPFYTILLIEFLVRALQLDLVSEQGATLVFRVTKVLAQPGLMDFIQRGEHPMVSWPPVLVHDVAVPCLCRGEGTFRGLPF